MHYDTFIYTYNVFTLRYPLSALFLFCLVVFLWQKTLYVSLAVLEFTSTLLYLLSPGITNYPCFVFFLKIYS